MNGEPEITVTAFGQRYSAAFSRVIRIEGGFVNDPLDRGGATKFGVSLRFLVAEGKIDLDEDGVLDFDLDMDGDIDGADVRALTPADAKFLFRRCFWDRLECDSFPHPLGEAMFDQGVNGGNTAARKLLQRAINMVVPARALTVDGDIGQLTRKALALALARHGGLQALVKSYRLAAADRYRAIVARDPTQRRFLAGWLNRAAELGAA